MRQFDELASFQMLLGERARVRCFWVAEDSAPGFVTSDVAIRGDSRRFFDLHARDWIQEPRREDWRAFVVDVFVVLVVFVAVLVFVVVIIVVVVIVLVVLVVVAASSSSRSPSSSTSAPTLSSSCNPFSKPSWLAPLQLSLPLLPNSLVSVELCCFKGEEVFGNEAITLLGLEVQDLIISARKLNAIRASSTFDGVVALATVDGVIS